MNTISFRIAAAMLPALVLLLTLFGVATAVREGEVLEDEMQRDADAVAAVAAALIASGGEASALDVLALPRIRLELADAPPAAPLPGEVFAAAAVPGRPEAWVVVREPLADRDVFVRRALLTDAIGVLVSTVIAGLFAIAVGRTLVQARVLRIIARLDQVAREELGAAPLDLGTDELGQLGVAVDSMTADLQAARARAADEAAARRRAQLQLRRADRLALIGRTVAVFAHEVGNPLSVVVGRTERIARRHPEAAADAGIVLAQAERIAAFVRRLLDYARHDDGFELLPTALAPLVEQAVELVDDRARARGVRVVAELPAAPRAEVDAQALVQAITNLLANAVDASPPGGRVEIELAEVRCEEAGRALEPEHVHIAVRDRGEGIPEALRDRVLDPFFTTKAAGEGTGLGLSIVVGIAGDHGGVLTLDEREGGGCEATLHLPRAGGERA